MTENTPQTPTPPRLYALAELIAPTAEIVETRRAAQLSGLPFGPTPPLPGWADALGGAFMPGFHGLMGGPGSGKSALALQTAAQARTPALYVTCEMAPQVLMLRLLAMTSRVSVGDVLRGKLSKDGLNDALATLAGECPELLIADAHGRGFSLEWLGQTAAELSGNKLPGALIVLDSFHAAATALQSDLPEYDLLTGLARSLSAMGSHTKTAVLAILEQNRTALKDGKGSQHGAKGSSAIEFSAESMTTILTNPADRQADGQARDIALRVDKNRWGGNRDIGASFDPLQMRFESRAGTPAYWEKDK